MTRYIYILIALQIPFGAFSQKLTGEQLLEKAITYHDPNGNWSSFQTELTITMSRPNADKRTTKVQLDFPEQLYSATVKQDGNTITSILKRDNCTLLLNGSKDISKTLRDSLRISCDRAKMMKNYYTYLYGLPMKLKDPGTRVHNTVEKKIFKKKEYLVLKVDYSETVGKDTWYFYFDPKTYAMEVYQFYHDESKNDGEYILLSDTIEVQGIKIPKIRAWYYNADDKYLATDTLTEAKTLE